MHGKNLEFQEPTQPTTGNINKEIMKCMLQTSDICDKYDLETQQKLGSNLHIIKHRLQTQPVGSYFFPLVDFLLKEEDITRIPEDIREHWLHVLKLDPQKWLLGLSKDTSEIFDLSGNNISPIEIDMDNLEEYKIKFEVTPADVLFREIINKRFVIDYFTKKCLNFGGDIRKNTVCNMNPYAGEGIQSQYLLYLLQTIGIETVNNNHFNNDFINNNGFTRKIQMQDRVESYLNQQIKNKEYQYNDLGATIDFAMVPFKLVNNIFLDQATQNKMKEFILSMIKENNNYDNEMINQIKIMPWINDREETNIDTEQGYIKFQDKNNKITISAHNLETAGDDVILCNIPFKSLIPLEGHIGFSKYLDRICDYVYIGYGKNKCEACFAGITNIVDHNMDVTQSTQIYNGGYTASNPQYMIDSTLKDAGFIIPNKKGIRFKKNNWEERMTQREKFLAMREAMIQTIYHNIIFKRSGSLTLAESRNRLVNT